MNNKSDLKDLPHYDAVFENNTEIFKFLLDYEVNANPTDEECTSFFTFAAFISKSIENVQVLFDYGVDINTKYTNGKTCLHLAANDDSSETKIQLFA